MAESQVFEGIAGSAERLDVFAAALAGVTRSRAGALVKDGHVLVDGAAQAKAGYMLKPGAAVRVTVPVAAPATVAAEDIDLDIVYQDADLAVVFKPSGMVVHPAAGNESGTLVNALLRHLDNLSGIGGEIRPGIVHRIDKDTSGLLLVAKNDFSHVALSEQIRAHTVKRAYRAIVIGGFRQDEGTVDAPIGRHPTDRKRMAIVPGGREAVTHWTVLRPLRGATLIEARLTTGRTHQIRVHMASAQAVPVPGGGRPAAACLPPGLHPPPHRRGAAVRGPAGAALYLLAGEADGVRRNGFNGELKMENDG